MRAPERDVEREKGENSPYAEPGSDNLRIIWTIVHLIKSDYIVQLGGCMNDCWVAVSMPLGRQRIAWPHLCACV